MMNFTTQAFTAIILFLALYSVQAAEQSLKPEERLVKNGPATLQVTIYGKGQQTLVCIPSLGRDAADFKVLAAPLVKAGYRVVLPEPRGIGKSTGPMKDVTLHDFAADLAAVIESLGNAPVTLIGHAFGSRVARMTAADHPKLVKQIILLGAGDGGYSVPIPPDVSRALTQTFDEALPRSERLAAIARAFFADGNDPAVWEHGWHKPTRDMQSAASRATPAQEWRAAGTVPILVLQAMNDTVSPPETAQKLRQEFPSRVTVTEIPKAGHAMLPEQPELIARAILRYLKR